MKQHQRGITTLYGDYYIGYNIQLIVPSRIVLVIYRRDIKIISSAKLTTLLSSGAKRSADNPKEGRIPWDTAELFLVGSTPIKHPGFGLDDNPQD